MSAALLLEKLDGVKRTGQGRWMARCPAHQDKRPSLSVRELDDGRVLVHCFSNGCSAHEIVSAAGLEISDLFPPRPDDPAQFGKPERRPFPAADILRAVAFEALVVGCAASAMLAGEPFTQADRDRLLVAVGRIQAALDAGGLNHG
ncbi:MAG: DNA primase [Betaproteobacteria bacterium]|nr:DNA primase [Betaproteobacteria bacterium]